MSVTRSSLRPVDRAVPGDPSAAAFFVVAGCVVPGSRVTVEHVYGGPARLGFVSVLQRMGAAVAVVPDEDGTVSITASSGPLRGTEVPASEIPSLDEVPALAVAAAVAEGTTVFTDVGELRVKEVDRLAAVAAMVEAFGAVASVDEDTLAVTGTGGALRGARVDSLGDHRMAMASAVAALAAPPGERSLVDGVRRGRDELPPLRRRPGVARGRAAAPACAARGHRRTGRRREVHRLERSGRAPRARPARHRRHVPGRRRGGPGPGDRRRRHGRGGGAGPRPPPSRSASAWSSTGRTSPGRSARPRSARPSRWWPPIPRCAGRWCCGSGPGPRPTVAASSRAATSARWSSRAPRSKVYLTATADERARRRDDEAPEGVARRDRIDSTRDASPLREAEDAHRLDTTGRTVQDVVEEVLSWL